MPAPRDSSIELAIANPLVAGPLRQPEPAVFDAAVSVPEISAIPAGFDAIFQFAKSARREDGASQGEACQARDRDPALESDREGDARLARSADFYDRSRCALDGDERPRLRRRRLAR